MSIFEQEFRRIGTRDITLTPEQIDNFRIKKIFNSFGDPHFLNDEHAEEILDKFIKRGEYCLLEATYNGKVYKITLITFEDIWSRNMFALMNFDYYKGFLDLISLYN